MKTEIIAVKNLFLGIGLTEIGLSLVTLPFQTRNEAAEALAAELKSIKTCSDRPVENNELLGRVRKEMISYFEGKRSFLEQLAIDLTPHRLTPFQLRVLKQVKTIPYGATRTYQWIAAEINNPQGVRAVGQAVGRNPLLIVIPCHRVIRSDGTLGGFTGGLAHKEYLLKLEGVNWRKLG